MHGQGRLVIGNEYPFALDPQIRHKFLDRVIPEKPCFRMHVVMPPWNSVVCGPSRVIVQTSYFTYHSKEKYYTGARGMTYCTGLEVGTVGECGSSAWYL